MSKYIEIMERKCKIHHESVLPKKLPNTNTIALNMIVKNEQDNILRTFESVKDFCDIFTILDTGSDDDTINIIIKYCKNINKPLFLISYPFENFSITRNIAIEYAKNMADYLLFMDSNDELKNVKPELKKFIIENRNNERMLGFYIKQEWNTHGKIDRYFNIRLVKSSEDWHYKAPVHEYITCPKVEKNGTSSHVIRIGGDNVYIFQDRSKDAHKSTKRFTRDKELLFEEYKKNPHDSRTLFYLAQTCSCLFQYEESYKYYILRTKEKGFMEEVFHSYLRAAEIAHGILKYSVEEVLFLFMKALDISCRLFNCPRAEPLLNMANIYLSLDNKLMAHTYIKLACQSVTPTDTSLFVDGDAYDYKRWNMLGITGFYVNDFNLGAIGCMFAYVNGKKEIDINNLKTYIDTKLYDFDKLLEFLDKQTTQTLATLFISKKTNNNLQNHFLINNLQSVLDKFKL